MLKTLCIALKLCTSLSGYVAVVDGDTIIVESRHIRLAGLDAEELNEPHGLAAKQRMIDLTRGIISCQLTGERSYNRYVATCYTAAGVDLAAEMVRSGMALDCARYSNGKYRGLEPMGATGTLIQKPYCRQ